MTAPQQGDPTAGIEALNGPQADAVRHVDGPLIVFAGAGSGKTRVITYRIANLIATHRVPPYRILAVTFTNKAAQEMRHRLDGILGEGITGDLWMGTFHSVCVRLLRRYHEEAGLSRHFVIYDTADQKAVMKRILKDLRIDEKRFPPQKVLARIHSEKQEGRGFDEFSADNYFDEVIGRCFEAYEERLKAASAVDFEDLLLHVLRLAEGKGPVADALRSRYWHVLVDEFQDVNLVQYRLVRAFSSEQQNICVVGDDDQSIYAWRGADIRNIRGFTRDYPDAKLVKLEQNYRSSGHIVSAALGIIARSRDRTKKELWTDNADGEAVRVVHAANERDEAAWVVGRVRELIDEGVSAREIAIFYRVHAQSRVLEEVMRNGGIPYQIIGGTKFFERAEVKDLLAYMRVLSNPQSDVDLLRIINVPPRKIGKKTIEALAGIASEQRIGAYDAIEPLCDSGRVGTAAKRSLRAFNDMMEQLARQALTASPHELAEAILEDSGYAASLKRQDTAEADARLDNLKELLGSIAEYEETCAAADEKPTVEDYLAGIALAADADKLEDVPRVPMMTIHAAKGLEFDHVFLTGMEERMFPLRGQEPGEEDQLEEERRLAYVAVTRARKILSVVHTNTRMIYGQTRYNTPSRFLGDMKKIDVQLVVTKGLRDLPFSSGGGGSRGRLQFGLGRSGLGGSAPARRRAGGRPDISSLAGGGRGAKAPTRQPGERYVERIPDADMGFEEDVPMFEEGDELRVGMRVRHKRFGVGVVVAASGTNDITATVKFDGWGAKRIKAAYLFPA